MQASDSRPPGPLSASDNLDLERGTDEGFLDEEEEWWRDHYDWLQNCGYRLRPRYSPGWVPSWKGQSKDPLTYQFEDGQTIHFGNILDATRISDGKFVVLKSTKISKHPYETEIGIFFSSGELASDPANRCVPILDVLRLPDDRDVAFIVMPLLKFFYDPRFDTFGETIAFFDQVFEGLHFMHKHHVAHRDITILNVMMDASPLYRQPYHPAKPIMRRDWKGKAKHFTRTQRPVKYYLLDFGLSRKYPPEESNPLEYPILGGDKTVPEFQESAERPWNPFPTDVYYLGNMVRQYFIQERYGFEFMTPLVVDMVQNDPSKRPNMDEVITRYKAIRASLTTWKLRSRVVLKSDWSLLGFFRTLSHWYRRIGLILRRVPAIPTPEPVTV